MEVIDLEGVISYIKAVKVVYPAVEWRIKLNGKVQEEDEEDDKDKPNAAGHINATFILLASVVFLYLY